MSERAYQQHRLADGLPLDPCLTKPGNERERWRVTCPLQAYYYCGFGQPTWSADFANRLDAENFCRDMPAGSFTIEPV